MEEIKFMRWVYLMVGMVCLLIILGALALHDAPPTSTLELRREQFKSMNYRLDKIESDISLLKLRTGWKYWNYKENKK